MYELAITLGEPIEDVLILQQGDAPLLELTAYDYDGTAWDTGYTGTFIVGRSGSDPDEWSIAESVAIAPVDNVFLFNIEEVTYTRGVYWGYLYVINATETTPVVDSVEYSFSLVKIEVV